MLKKGGIYQYKDTIAYFVVIDITKTRVYYYQILSIATTKTISRDLIIAELNHQIDNILLKNNHNYFFTAPVENVEKVVNGYVGNIYEEQIQELEDELKKVEFDKNGYAY